MFCIYLPLMNLNLFHLCSFAVCSKWCFCTVILRRMCCDFQRSLYCHSPIQLSSFSLSQFICIEITDYIQIQSQDWCLDLLPDKTTRGLNFLPPAPPLHAFSWREVPSAHCRDSSHFIFRCNLP